MKRILAFVIVLAMTVSLAACGGKEGSFSAIDGLTPQQITYLLTDMTDIGLQYCMNEKVDAGNVGAMIGAGEFKGEFESAQALVPMMSISPLVVIVFRLAENADSAAFAAELKEKANLNKWICVSADTAEAHVVGNTVIFYMCLKNDAAELASCVSKIQSNDFKPEEHMKDPVGSKTMVELYDELYDSFAVEMWGFMDNDGLHTISEDSKYGLDAIDKALYTDSLVDDGYANDELLGERAYLLVMLRLADEAQVQGVLDLLMQNRESYLLQGEGLQGIFAHSGNVIVMFFGTGDYGITAGSLQMTLESEYRMNTAE